MPRRERWVAPPAPWPRDVRRWRAFCAVVDKRIRAIRSTEGIGRRDAWVAFEPALAPLTARRPLPIGYVAPMPSNVAVRGPGGRYVAVGRTG